MQVEDEAAITEDIKGCCVLEMDDGPERNEE